MEIHAVNGIAGLVPLLKPGNNQTPGVILVGSGTCPSCQTLHEEVKQATQPASFKLYAIDVDAYAEPALNIALRDILRPLGIEYLPSQILLPANGKPKVICKFNLPEIKQELAKLQNRVAV
ncbi:hypothetical protein [Pseudomonas sp.]|uniref:hypothetical protein n=1 Tax=Pseudomonas sp. TaxID=306 RepID=UPI003D6FD3CE